MTNTDRLAELLNLTRSGAWNSDAALEFGDAIRAASDTELRLALLHFAQGLARTSLTLKTCQLHAAIAEQAIAEREQNGGHLQ